MRLTDVENWDLSAVQADEGVLAAVAAGDGSGLTALGLSVGNESHALVDGLVRGGQSHGDEGENGKNLGIHF